MVEPEMAGKIEVFALLGAAAGHPKSSHGPAAMDDTAHIGC